MEKLKLVLADDSYKLEYLDFVKECGDDLKISGFDCCIPLSTIDTFDNDIINLQKRRNGIDLPMGWVSDSVLWMIDEIKNNIIGCICIRHSLNEKLKFRGGHIAYYIRISERNKRYGSKMLSLGLKYSKEILKLEKVLITCSENNIYSVNIIQNNGGIFHSEDMENDDKFLRYYIDLLKL